VVNKTFWAWFFFALAGIVTLYFVPAKMRGWIILALFLGGVVALDRAAGGPGKGVRLLIETIRSGGQNSNG
jgi:hypothetical protein